MKAATASRTSGRDLRFGVTFSTSNAPMFPLLLGLMLLPAFVQPSQAAFRLPDTIEPLATEGFKAMYRHDFARGEEKFRAITEQMPAHPAGYIFLASMYWWQYSADFETPNEALEKKFFAAAHKGIEKARAWKSGGGQNIEADFWLEDEETYAIALDRDKRPCAVVTSNPGHLLWCGVPDAARARRLAARLLRADLFCGWGIRTVASGQPRYNPMSYHNGSVWPHDNSLIAAGLRSGGRVEGALEVLTALVEAALHFEDRRLPELFCGFGRRRDTAPVPYPVACRPHAWAAASVFLLLESRTARRACAALHRERLQSQSGDAGDRNLRVGEARVDLNVVRGKYGGSVEILRKEGELEVVETR